MAYSRRIMACDMCAKSTRKGALWLGGGDWVECPNCQGTAEVEAITEVVQAHTQALYTPRAGGGLTKSTRVILPHGGSHEVRGS